MEINLDKKTRYGEFLKMLQIFRPSVTELKQIMNTCSRLKPQPEYVFNCRQLTFGQVYALLAMKTADDWFYLPFQCLLHLDKAAIDELNASQCLRLLWQLRSEMERIVAQLNEASMQPEALEIAAGIENLNHGVFGIADWYARRMGITNHEEVYRTPWLHVLWAMKIDKKNIEYQRCYQKLLAHKNGRR